MNHSFERRAEFGPQAAYSSKFRDAGLWRYGLAIGSVGVAIVCRLLLDPVLPTHYSASPFFAAIVVTTWMAGFGPSLAAVLLGYVGLAWFAVGPHVLQMPGANLSGTLLYFCVSLVIVSFGRSMHEAQRRLREEHALLEQEVAERARIEQQLLDTQKELERRAAELEARYTERAAVLQETVNSLEGMCYGIAHDLRSPIRAMHACVSALEQHYPEATESSSKIKALALRMDKLIEDLLSYGRLSHGELKLEPVNLDSEVACVIQELEGEISKKGAIVTVHGPLPIVLGSPVVIRQVVTNLLGNALKFVRIGVIPRIQITATDGLTARLCVQDNGIGIDPRFHQQIFKLFERLHSKDAYPGTGIGLAVVKKATERMGGSVGLESQPGKGSAFWIELPSARR